MFCAPFIPQVYLLSPFSPSFQDSVQCPNGYGGQGAGNIEGQFNMYWLDILDIDGAARLAPAARTVCRNRLSAEEFAKTIYDRLMSFELRF